MHHITITAVRRFIRTRTHLSARSVALTLLVVILGGLLAACGEAAGGAGATTPTPTPPAQVNQAPTVQAGTDQTIQLPTDSVTLSGSATDPENSACSRSTAGFFTES